MGYHVHITRKKHWADPNGAKISAEEWLAYVASDPQLRLLAGSKTHLVITDIGSPRPSPELEWSENGYIWTNKPDEHMLAKMLQIASALGARVQGWDGAVYRSANLDDYVFPEDTSIDR